MTQGMSGEAVLVAKSRSRYGGRCQSPNHGGARNIRQGEVIFKVSAFGPTTPQGQGPGFWICETCADKYEDPKGLL